ncbi:hypothetical protein [European catfish virus]|uniref:Uncharacterized protein n=1 Tax=European catfish virus TaxID=84739 RepID=I2BFK0_9VIRU|nr:hypothetical protein A190_gp020 [European catfish virus]AFJ52303.1 hypothetical protein [European catfish virus]AMZ04849.1 hypothetical protein [European catfish virus]AMZ04985.1 hypothetical protein [European catfish virus]
MSRSPHGSQYASLSSARAFTSKVRLGFGGNKVSLSIKPPYKVYGLCMRNVGTLALVTTLAV